MIAATLRKVINLVSDRRQVPRREAQLSARFVVLAFGSNIHPPTPRPWNEAPYVNAWNTMGSPEPIDIRIKENKLGVEGLEPCIQELLSQVEFPTWGYWAESQYSYSFTIGY